MINFEKLKVYQDSLTLTSEIYLISKSFPREEIFGITSQLRRAAVSVSLNIAEGSSRSKKDFVHFLNISRGSAYEIIALLRICLNLGYLKPGQYERLYDGYDDLVKRINALRKKIGEL